MLQDEYSIICRQIASRARFPKQPLVQFSHGLLHVVAFLHPAQHGSPSLEWPQELFP